MKIEIIPDYGIALKEVYNSIQLITDSGEGFSICMRDSGFEFYYGNKWYEAKEGIIRPLKAQVDTATVNEEIITEGSEG